MGGFIVTKRVVPGGLVWFLKTGTIGNPPMWSLSRSDAHEWPSEDAARQAMPEAQGRPGMAIERSHGGVGVGPVAGQQTAHATESILGAYVKLVGDVYEYAFVLGDRVLEQLVHQSFESVKAEVEKARAEAQARRARSGVDLLAFKSEADA